MSDDILDYEATLAYAQRTRRTIVDHYMEGGVPQELKEVDTVLKALKDMDTTALNDRKNNIDEKSADGSKEIANALMEAVRLQQNRNPFEAPEGEVERDIPTLDKAQLGDFELVDGEGDPGGDPEKADDFLKRMDEQRLASYKREDEE